MKSYLLKGYVIQNRIENIEKKLFEQDSKIEFLLNTTLPPNQGVFYDGQIFDAYSFVSKLIKSAKYSIILFDNYIDETVLLQLSKREKGVAAIIYTKDITKQLQLDLNRFKRQYEPIKVKEFAKSHDRFLIIDDTEVYHIGASLKDLGKKWFTFSKLNIDATALLGKL